MLALFLLSPFAAQAQIRWLGGFDTSDVRRWYEVQCGGQNGTCPCMSPFINPAGQSNYGSGTCTTSNTNSPLSLAPQNGRFQIVSPPPGAESVGEALRIELRNGDLWPCASGCGSATTRNELVYSQDSGTTLPTEYHPGDERWFAWSTWFDPSFASWSCNDAMDATGSDSQCPNGVPTSSYNPWNVFMQFHQNSDSGVNPIGMDLRRTRLSSNNTYAMILLLGTSGGKSDTELWRNELRTGVWYDFVLHVKFSANRQGVLELWVGNDGGARAKQTLTCPNGSSQTCSGLNTVYGNNGYDYLKSGLYRNSSLLDDVFVFHKGMVDGGSYADVTGDFSISVAPSSQTVSAGQTATYTVQTAATAGAAQLVTLSASGFPPGVTGASFNPTSVTAGGSATLTVTTSATATAVSGSFTVSGQYPGGGTGHATTATLVIGP